MRFKTRIPWDRLDTEKHFRENYNQIADKDVFMLLSGKNIWNLVLNAWNILYPFRCQNVTSLVFII